MDRYKQAIENEIKKGGTLEGAKVVLKDVYNLRVMTKEGYIYEITESKVELLGKQGENEEIDLEDPNQAEVSFNSTTVDTETEIIATVTQSDNGESGVNITRCKWIYTESDALLGKDESRYTGGSFKGNPEEIKTIITSIGTYYLHILTVDNAGNKTETVKGPITVTKAPLKAGVIVTDKNETYTKNGTAVIPVGFAIVPGCDDVSQGLVISDVENDIEDTGNQFVWIPVEEPSVYARNGGYTTSNGFTWSNLHDNGQQLPSGIADEKEIVFNAKGFYIARYETGTGCVSKKGATTWTMVTGQQVGGLAKGFINNDYVKSALVSGTQWDVTLAFVNGKLDGNGQVYYVTQVNSKRYFSNYGICGVNEADKVCNIYDLSGNVREHVAEVGDVAGYQGFWIERGGSRKRWL